MRFCWILLLFTVTSAALARDHAVILVYHHVSETTPGLTSVTPDTFDSHLDYLQQNDFTVWPLSRIIDTLRANEPLPQNTVAITFDDAYQSVYSEAFPRLQDRGWPFTVFVSSEAVDRGYAEVLDWRQLRQMAKAGVELGNHSHTHAHLVRYLPGESAADWARRIRADIDTAKKRLQAETGSRSRLFAYPYGEYSDDVKAIVEDAGYHGIAQQSGAIGAQSDFLALPRFPMSRGYSDLNRFATSVKSKPLPVTDIETVAMGAEAYQPLRSITLTLEPGNYRRAQLACYRSTGKRLDIETVADDPLRLTITLDDAQPAGRHKVNCTAPDRAGAGVFYWYSIQWLVRQPDGGWYRG